MLRAILVLAALVAHCSARCCTPSQWEGFQGAVGQTVANQKAELSQTANVISYDGVNTKLAVILNGTAGSVQIARRVIQNFQEGVAYTIDLLTNKCTKNKISGPMQSTCIPDNAVEILSMNFGGGKNRLQGESYSWKQTSAGVDVSIAFTVSRDDSDCYPVGEVVTGTANNAQLLQVLGYSNITKGIKDPTVFTPPPSCNQVPITEGSFKQSYRFLGL